MQKFFLSIVLATSLIAGANAHADELEILSASIPPYTYMERGKQKGLIVDIVEALAKHTGHSGKITFLPWKRALQMTKTGKTPKLIVPLNRSPEREDIFRWVQELYVDNTVLVTRKGQGATIKKIEEALPLKTGVLLGSPLEAQLRTLGFKDVDPAVNEETNARKLQAARIKVWHVARLVAPFVYERQGFKPKDLQYGIGLDANDLYLGASPGLSDQEARKWQDAFKKIKKDGTFAKILSKHLD